MAKPEQLTVPNPATTPWVPVGGTPGPTGPAGPTGPPGPTGTGVPTPVVNGQWIKGVGGAAVWSPITAADVSGVEMTSNKGVASGYAGITSGSLVDAPNGLIVGGAVIFTSTVGGPRGGATASLLVTVNGNPKYVPIFD